MDISKQKVLVTGADGFIGSHLVEALLGEGCFIRAFVYYNSFNSWGWLDTFPKEKLDAIEIFTGDIRDPRGVEKAMEGCGVVFHLAALIAIPFSYHSPDSYVDTNIKGTLNVLQAARHQRTQKVIITSTSEVYGTAQYVPIDESHPYQGQSPYSATKIGADRVAESFYRAFDVPVAIARPFNTFGPRQSARAIIPTIITQLISGSKEIRLGRMDTIRDFNYVKDVARAFIEIARTDKTIGEELNIATGTGASMGEIAAMVMDLVGRKAKIVLDDIRVRPEKSEVLRLIGSNEKLTSLTGWKPAYTIQTGLQETIEWLRRPENFARYKTSRYML